MGGPFGGRCGHCSWCLLDRQPVLPDATADWPCMGDPPRRPFHARSNLTTPTRSAIAAAIPAWAEVRRLWKLPDADFVRGLYELLFDRPAADAEVAAHAAALAAGGDRADLVRRCAAADECRTGPADTSWLPQLERLQPRDAW